MTRRSTAAGKAAKAQRRKTGGRKSGIASKAADPSNSSARDEKTEVARLTRERDEALEQQLATADVLKVVSRSSFDLQLVLETLVESAAKLCKADFADIWRPYGPSYRVTATYQTLAAHKEYLTNLQIKPSRGSCVGRTLLDAKIVHIHDIREDAEYALDLKKLGDRRTMLGVPLLRDGKPIGVIALTRSTVRPFTARQIDLVTTFADQAVIAIENTRLLNETQEALARQTATADVLKVISRSAFDLDAVLGTLVESAARLCEAERGILFLRKGNECHVANVYGFSPELEAFARAHPIPIDGASTTARAAASGIAVQTVDLLADPALNEVARQYQKLGGHRTNLGVPLKRNGEIIGVFTLTRQIVRAFTDKQIELVQTFADQAVIAIENARLFDEVQAKTRDLSESLQQQTATADVLKVISRSVFDLQTVLKTLVGSAVELAGAFSGAICIRDGETFRYRAGAGPGYSEKLQQFIESAPVLPGRGSIPARVLLSGKIEEIPDVLEDREYKVPLASLGLPARALLGVPLLGKQGIEGSITLVRREPGRFAPRIIELVQTFADQAVIAIENARLLNETKESLEQQTATSEVLQIINASPGDLKPVFDAMLDKAMRLCEASFGGLAVPDGELARWVASRGVPEAFDDWLAHQKFRLSSLLGPSFRDRSLLHVLDVKETEGYRKRVPSIVATVELGGARTCLLVPLVKDDALVGVIVLYRQEARAFSDKQIALLENFAAQAVIAIENARLLTEQREALQQQTATADVLKAISRSAFDLETVLNALVEAAARLCEADQGTIARQHGNVFVRVASWGFSDEFNRLVQNVPVRAERGSATGRALLERRTVHIADVDEDPEYTFADAKNLGGFKTIIAVPMLREGLPIGVLALTRIDRRPFTSKQIELVETFSDQAAIAIENVRLFEEVQAKTSDLAESLQFQTATSNVLRVISRSPDNLQPVLDVIVETSRELCTTDASSIFLLRDQKFYLAAVSGSPPVHFGFMQANPLALDAQGSVLPRAVREKRTIYIPNVAEDPELSQGYSGRGGPRALLAAPLMSEGQAIGVLVLRQSHLKPFTKRQIEAAETFADQAVIAISNVNLFEQVQLRTRELSQSLDNLRAAQDRLIQTEKLASLGQLTAGIAHEIKNPLNFVNNFSALSAELVDEMNDVLDGAGLNDKRRGEFDEIRKLLKSNLEKVVQHGNRADSIVKNMLLHSRSGSGEYRPVEINAVIDESLNLAYHGARAEGKDFNITLERDFDPGAGVAEIYPQEITRVFLNLISNGFYAATKRAAEAGNGFEPRLTAVTRNLGDKVEIRIRDNGMGIPPDIREKIFNPFFTTKPAGEGTGLGLSMSHDIVVKQHGGTIEVVTEPGSSTELIITLPRVMPAQAESGRQGN